MTFKAFLRSVLMAALATVLVACSNDGSGNTTNVTVTNPVPVVTVLGENPISIAQGESYSDLGATALNSQGGAVQVTVSGEVDTSKAGTYTLIYTAVDSEGNTTTTSRTINVVDKTPPVITLVGDSSVNVIKNSVYSELGATAKDGDIDVDVITTGSIDMSAPGEYTITYTATDGAGNTATATRTINVVAGKVSKTFTYDIFGRVVNEDFGDGRSIAYTYDDSGNLINQTVVGGE